MWMVFTGRFIFPLIISLTGLCCQEEIRVPELSNASHILASWIHTLAWQRATAPARLLDQPTRTQSHTRARLKGHYFDLQKRTSRTPQ